MVPFDVSKRTDLLTVSSPSISGLRLHIPLRHAVGQFELARYTPQTR